MTKQEIFDTVALHLIKQGKKSVNDIGRCLYRSPEGLKCAIGCLIPDEVYQRSMEGHGVSRLLGNYDSLKFLWPFDAILNALQITHDKTCGEGQTWTDAVVLRLRKIAEKYNLSTKIIDEIITTKN
jgi:hypothetical protein